MMFKNTIRLVMANFSSVWKLLLYYLICIAVVFAVFYPVAQPIIDKLRTADVFDQFGALLNSVFASPGTLATKLTDMLSTIGSVLSANASKFIFNYIFLILLVFFIAPFIFGLGDLAVGEVLYGYMSSQTKYSFTGGFIKNIGKSCLLQLTKLLFLIPFNIVIVAAFYGIISLFAAGSIGLIFTAFLLMLAIIIVLTLKETMFSCWMPGVAVRNDGPFKAMKNGFKAAFRNFGRIFSTTLFIFLTALALNVFFGIFTLGLAFIISLPLTIMMFTTFNMTAYFTCQGMRFYVYPDVFITPKKMEEQDNTKRLRYLI